MISTSKVPACHPDRKHLAKGLCESCYRVMQRKRLQAKMTDEERENQRAQEREYGRVYRQAWREDPDNHAQELVQQRKYAREAYQRDPEKYRHRQTSQRYGLTIPEYRELIASANGHCQCCGTPCDRLQIDHCHETGALRGVICGGCNSALGHAKDDTQRLRSLIAYLEGAS